jgi:hypothetical protein
MHLQQVEVFAESTVQMVQIQDFEHKPAHLLPAAGVRAEGDKEGEYPPSEHLK